MRALLTPALAAQNPKAYVAHFRRLEADAQRHYLGGLSVEELREHFRATGDPAVVGLVLEVSGEHPRLEASVGGSALGRVEGLEAVTALQARAVGVGEALSAKTVSGLLKASLPTFERGAGWLSALGWIARSIVLAGDSGGADCAPALSWSVRGVCPGGSFYMAAEPLIWAEREAVRAVLKAAAARLGAVLDERLG